MSSGLLVGPGALPWAKNNKRADTVVCPYGSYLSDYVRQQLFFYQEKGQTNKTHHPDYQDIQWTYSEAPRLTCNGIKVNDDSGGYKFDWNSFYIRKPNISIFDYNANLPLNLQRTTLTQDKYSFHEELRNDALKDFIAYVLVNAPFELTYNANWRFNLNYPGTYIGYEDNYMIPWLFTKDGFSFTYDIWHTSQMNARYALIVHSYIGFPYYAMNDFIGPFSDPSQAHAVFLKNILAFRNKKEFAKSLSDRIEISPENYFLDHDISQKFIGFFIRGKRILISRFVLAFIDSVATFENEKILSEKFISQVVKEWENENWVLWRWGDCPPAGFDFEKFASENDGKNYKEWPCILGEWYFKDKNERPVFELTPLAKIWRDIVGSPIIPFDLEERRQMKAYKELKPYIDAHEKMKGKW